MLIAEQLSEVNCFHPIEVTLAFRRVKFHLLAQNRYFQLNCGFISRLKNTLIANSSATWKRVHYKISLEPFQSDYKQLVKLPRNYQVLAYLTVLLFHLKLSTELYTTFLCNTID